MDFLHVEVQVFDGVGDDHHGIVQYAAGIKHKVLRRVELVSAGIAAEDMNAPAAAATFVTENHVSRIVTGMHDGGSESFLVMFNRFAPEVSITMVAKDNLIYSMDVSRAAVR